MKYKTAKNIARIWRDIEKFEPDISTEQLMARTAETATRRFGREIDNGDVGEALALIHEKRERSKNGQ